MKDFEVLLNLGYDNIFLVETWLNDDHCFDIEQLCSNYNYKQFNIYRDYSRGGGLMILTKFNCFRLLMAYKDLFVISISSTLRLAYCLVYFPPDLVINHRIDVISHLYIELNNLINLPILSCYLVISI